MCDDGGCSDAFATVMQQWQKSVVRQQKVLQKAVLSRFIPIEGDPRQHIRALHAQEFRGLMNQLCVEGKDAACFFCFFVVVVVVDDDDDEDDDDDNFLLLQVRCASRSSATVQTRAQVGVRRV